MKRLIGDRSEESVYGASGEDAGGTTPGFDGFVVGESCGCMAMPGSMTGGCTYDSGWGSVGGVTTILGSILGRAASGLGALFIDGGGGGGFGVPPGDKPGGGGGAGTMSAASTAIEANSTWETSTTPIMILRAKNHRMLIMITSYRFCSGVPTGQTPSYGIRTVRMRDCRVDIATGFSFSIRCRLNDQDKGSAPLS